MHFDRDAWVRYPCSWGRAETRLSEQGRAGGCSSSQSSVIFRQVCNYKIAKRGEIHCCRSRPCAAANAEPPVGGASSAGTTWNKCQSTSSPFTQNHQRLVPDSVGLKRGCDETFPYIKYTQPNLADSSCGLRSQPSPAPYNKKHLNRQLTTSQAPFSSSQFSPSLSLDLRTFVSQHLV